MIQKIADLIAGLIKLLPSDPILSGLEKHMEDISGYMGYVNWAVPFKGILEILELWCAALFAYYIFVTNKELLMKLVNHLLDSLKSLLGKLFSTGGE